MTPRRDAWPAGVPAWVSLTVPDVGAATGFYGDLLGWEFLEGASPDGRAYLTATRDGHHVAGLGQAPQGSSVAQWTVFLATDDMARTIEDARAEGAALPVPPTAVDGSGEVALLTDPTGAYTGLWQAGEHAGVTLVDAPGAMAWCELLVTDLAAARRFYSAVFQYTYTDEPDAGAPYVSFAVRGHTAGGIGALPEASRTHGSHWLVYFAVPDVDAALAVVESHGGSVEGPAVDTPYGRVAVVSGPSGERLALTTPA